MFPMKEVILHGIFMALVYKTLSSIVTQFFTQPEIPKIYRPFNQNSPKYFQKSKLFDIKYYILKNWIQCFTFRPLFQQNKALCNSKLINTPNITLHIYANINNKVTTRNRLWFYVHMWIKPVQDGTDCPYILLFFPLVTLTQCGTTILDDCTKSGSF